MFIIENITDIFLSIWTLWVWCATWKKSKFKSKLKATPVYLRGEHMYLNRPRYWVTPNKPTVEVNAQQLTAVRPARLRRSQNLVQTVFDRSSDFQSCACFGERRRTGVTQSSPSHCSRPIQQSQFLSLVASNVSSNSQEEGFAFGRIVNNSKMIMKNWDPSPKLGKRQPRKAKLC